MATTPAAYLDPRDRLPDTPLFDRPRGGLGYELNRMAMALMDPANREAFKRDESAFLDRFDLTAEQRAAVLARDWNTMMRLGGNLFYILKISAVDPVAITAIGAAQAGMDHDSFLYGRLGKRRHG